MNKIKLLIVDDIEDNRLVLKAICRKMENFEIFEAVDGEDAVKQAIKIEPEIILMDIMMPKLDGLSATKLIKARLKNSIIMAVTAVLDKRVEESMAHLGVEAYIRKPIDKNLLRLKLNTYAKLLTQKELSSNSSALNPFSAEVRSFKTIFKIIGVEGIMDFGVWVFERCHVKESTALDTMLELVYLVLSSQIEKGGECEIVVEESFEEIFIYIALKSVPSLGGSEYLIESLKDGCKFDKNSISFRVKLNLETVVDANVQTKPAAIKQETKAIEQPRKESKKEAHKISASEHQMLRESFVHKTDAAWYVQTIDNDILEEVRDLRGATQEWESWMASLSHDASESDFMAFATEVVDLYANAIDALGEFNAIAHSLTSLSNLIKMHSFTLANDEEIKSQFLLFLKGFKNDLDGWLEHIFGLSDAQDIHYLDGSFLSSYMFVESIVTRSEVAGSEESEIEFF